MFGGMGGEGFEEAGTVEGEDPCQLYKLGFYLLKDGDRDVLIHQVEVFRVVGVGLDV